MLAVGRRVQVYYGGGEELYEGEIQTIHPDGTSDIQYEDGDFEQNVPAEWIQRSNLDSVLQTLTSQWQDVKYQKQALADLLSLLKANDITAQDLVEIDAHRLIFSALRVHKTSRIVLSYGFVLIRKLCKDEPLITYDFVRDGMMELACFAMTDFPQDAILLASICSLIAAIADSGVKIKTELPYERLVERILSTLLVHKSPLEKLNRQVQLYGTQALQSLCELGGMKVAKLICGTKPDGYPGLELLRILLQSKNETIGVQICALLLCLASSNRIVAGIIRSSGLIAVMAPIMAKNMKTPEIEKYASTAAKLIAMSTLYDSHDVEMKSAARSVIRKSNTPVYLKAKGRSQQRSFGGYAQSVVGTPPVHRSITKTDRLTQAYGRQIRKRPGASPQTMVKKNISFAEKLERMIQQCSSARREENDEILLTDRSLQRKYDQQTRAQSNLTMELDQKTKEVEKVKAELESVKAQVEKQKLEQEAYDTHLAQYKEYADGIAQNLEYAQYQHQEIETKHSTLETTHQASVAELEQLRVELTTEKENHQVTQAKIAQLTQELKADQLKENYQLAQGKIAELTRELSTVDGELERVQTQTSKLRVQSTTTEANYQMAQAKIAELTRELAKSQAESQRLLDMSTKTQDAAYQAIAQELEQLRHAYSTLESSNQQLREHSTATETNHQLAEVKIAQLTRDVDQLRHEYSTLESLKQQQQVFFTAIEANYQLSQSKVAELTRELTRAHAEVERLQDHSTKTQSAAYQAVEQQLEQLRCDYSVLEHQLQSNEQKSQATIAELNDQLTKSQADLERNQGELERVHSQYIETHGIAQNEASREIETLRQQCSELESYRQSYTDVSERYEATRIELSELQEMYNGLQLQYAQEQKKSQSEFVALKKLQESYDDLRVQVETYREEKQRQIPISTRTSIAEYTETDRSEEEPNSSRTSVAAYTETVANDSYRSCTEEERIEASTEQPYEAESQYQPEGTDHQRIDHHEASTEQPYEAESPDGIDHHCEATETGTDAPEEESQYQAYDEKRTEHEAPQYEEPIETEATEPTYEEPEADPVKEGGGATHRSEAYSEFESTADRSSSAATTDRSSGVVSSSTDRSRAQGESSESEAEYTDDESEATTVTKDEWTECWDEERQVSYFYNPKRKESTWERPPELVEQTAEYSDGFDESGDEYSMHLDQYSEEEFE